MAARASSLLLAAACSALAAAPCVSVAPLSFAPLCLSLALVEGRSAAVAPVMPVLVRGELLKLAGGAVCACDGALSLVAAGATLRGGGCLV